MKFKKFFAGIIAAVTAVAAAAMPFTAVAADPLEPTGTLTIEKAVPNATYTAYRIFKGTSGNYVEKNDKGQWVICGIDFDDNMMTKYKLVDKSSLDPSDPDYSVGNSNIFHDTTSFDAGEKVSSTALVALYGILANSQNLPVKPLGINPNDNGNWYRFTELVKSYNNIAAPLTSTAWVATGKTTSTTQAEAIGNLLNLTKGSDTIKAATSAFYPAFAELAKACMISSPTSESVQTEYDATTKSYKAKFEGLKVGYYLVESSPSDNDGKVSPKGIKYSLVLVTPEGVTIHSKDTANIANISDTDGVMFYNQAGTLENGNLGFSSEKSVDNPNGGEWKKAVSMADDSYVKCRIIVDLPSNLADYTQYYLALPIMYDLNVGNKSLTRVGTTGDPETGTDKVNVYLYTSDTGEKTNITFPDNNNKLDVKKFTTNDDKKDDIYKLVAESQTTIGGTTWSTDGNKFNPGEAFVIKDILSIKSGEKTIKTLAEEAEDSLRLAFEFPVKFDRFARASGSLYVGKTNNDRTSNVNTTTYFTNDDFLKNYINVKAVYSNNPNLKDTAEGAQDYKIDTINEAINSIQNPVSYTKNYQSANIVTYRLRVQATASEMTGIAPNNGIGGVRFVLKKTINTKDGTKEYYATVKRIGTTNNNTYDTVVSGEFGFVKNSDGTETEVDASLTYTYLITGWNPVPDTGKIPEGTDASDTLTSYQAALSDSSDNKVSGRFEILGIDEGNYTLVDLNTSLSVVVNNISEKFNLKKAEFPITITPTLNLTDAPAPNFTGPTTGIVTTLATTTTDQYVLGASEEAALVSLKVEYAKEGITLPNTGGIGTFIFFAVGGALVIISTVVIVTRARVKRERL